VAAVLVCVGLTLPAPPAAAEFDWPATLALPDNDYALGISGGVAFGEELRGATTGWLVGLDASWLEGLLGIHGGLRVHREGFAHRLSGYAEVTVWYLVMIGVGTHFGAMLGNGGDDVDDTVVALHGYFGVPIPLARFDDGNYGTLVLVPYARPGMRFVEEGKVVGYHEAGISLRWTSFGF